MKTNKLTLLIIVAVVAIAHNSDGQQARPLAEQLKLAAVMPRGAMLYLQANDLGALMKMWLASRVRAQFYDSDSFGAFQKSRVYLKLQDRKKDFETALGFGLDETRLAELAGRASAVAIYDIGKIELVFVTEVARPRAFASALFKQAPKFQERSADGLSYYVRDVTTDGGRLNQQFCFAYLEGKLIVTTTEGLMIRALGNVKNSGADSLIGDVVALAEMASGFAAHDVTMWLDQARLNRNRYFDNYWIHNNASGELAAIESGLIDLRIAGDGLTEQRWFKMGTGGQGLGAGTLEAGQLGALMKFTPADAQFVGVHGGASADLISSAVEKALFGRLPPQTWAPPEMPDQRRKDTKDDEKSSAERYGSLDARFDTDVDDEQAPKRVRGVGGQGAGKRSAPEQQSSSFAHSIGALLSGASTGNYVELARSKTEAGKPFVSFERAIIAHLKSEAVVNREALERAIIDELRARFVISGADARLAWQDQGSIRFVAQSLLEQGAAYSMSGSYLVLASSKEFANDILKAANAQQAPLAFADATVDFYALIRVASAKPVFDTLMSKLDGTEKKAKPKRRKDDEEEEREVKFFSENLSSLIAASAVSEVRLSRRSDGGIVSERIVYGW
jgi:hypothetical protein